MYARNCLPDDFMSLSSVFPFFLASSMEAGLGISNLFIRFLDFYRSYCGYTYYYKVSHFAGIRTSIVKLPKVLFKHSSIQIQL